MKGITVLIFCATMFLSATTVAIPTYIGHQGRILQADNEPMAGVANVAFHLYSQASGGSAIWSQTVSVTFDDGYYSVVLGSGNPALSTDIFDGSERYLGVDLAGQEEFSPRHLVTVVPYAFLSGAVEGDVNATTGVFVNGVEIIDSSGNISTEALTVEGSLKMPRSDFSDFPSPSEDNKGQVHYASDQDVAYYSNGSEWVSMSGGGGGDIVLPVINSSDPTYAEPGQDVQITLSGEGFKSGCEVEIGSTLLSEVEFVSENEVTVMTGTEFSAGVYNIRLTNPEGLRYTLEGGFIADSAPAWDTSEGSLGVVPDSVTGDHFTLEATDPEGQTITYTLAGGSLPPGLALDQDSGVISGDPDDVESDTESSFIITATDSVGNSVDRNFSITVITGFGLDPSAAGDSCKHIFDSGSGSEDGLYWIDPDGDGGTDPFQVQCHMSSDGGGWTMVLNHPLTTGLFAVSGWSSGSQVGSFGDIVDNSGYWKLSDAMINSMVTHGYRGNALYASCTGGSCSGSRIYYWQAACTLAMGSAATGPCAQAYDDYEFNTFLNTTDASGSHMGLCANRYSGPTTYGGCVSHSGNRVWTGPFIDSRHAYTGRSGEQSGWQLWVK